MKNLSARAWIGLTFLAVVMASVLFVSADTVHYWEAWFYLGVFFGASILITATSSRTILRFSGGG